MKINKGKIPLLKFAQVGFACTAMIYSRLVQANPNSHENVLNI
ncbi:MAG: hypothetical protein V7K35_18315 [Nostoc sp.]